MRRTHAILKKNWSKIKRQLQFQYPWLEPSDLNYIEIYENEFLNNLQLRTGTTRKQLLDELNIIMLQV